MTRPQPGTDIAIRDHKRSSDVPSGARGPLDQGGSGLGGIEEHVGKTADGYAYAYVSLHFCQSRYSLNPPQRRKEGPITQQGHLRTEFYKLYQKEATEYDREFMKKYDDDLNTTLIFVRPAHRPNARSLTWTAGRSVFRGDLCIHRLGPSRTQA